jgi:hypothetical protein
LVRSAQRNALEIRKRLYLVFRILNGEHVVVPGLGVDPKARLDHAIRGQGGDHVIDDFLLAKAHLAGAHAVDVELQGRVIDVLRRKHVGNAGDIANLRGERERGVVGVGHV